MWKYVLLRAAFLVLGRLPIGVLYRLASLGGGIAYTLAPRARRNVWSNLRHVMPPGTPPSRMRKAARQVFRNVALYYADLAHLPHMDVQRFFDRRLKLYGINEHLMPAVKSGQGVVILGAHFGNPEFAAQGLIPLGVHLFALTEPQEPERLTRMLDEMRSSKGHTFAPVSVGNVKRVVRTLKQGGAVALMGDRDIEGPRARLPFLGVETLMPTGPIEVALRTGAVVVPGFSYRVGTRIIAYLEEPLDLKRTGSMEEDVRRGTLEFLARFEPHLRKDPGQWAVLESVWDGPGDGDQRN